MPLVLNVTESGGYELHDADEWYDGTITRYEEITQGQWGPGLKWIIVLDGEETADDGYPRETWAFTSQTLSPRSKLYGWAKALGWDPETGTLDPETLLGRCQVMFEHYAGYDPDGNPLEKEKVVKIRAGKGEAKPVKTKPAEPDDAPF